MPYTRYTELENGLEQTEVSLFGMWALTRNFALPCELPAMDRDITGTVTSAGLPSNDCAGSVALLVPGLQFARTTASDDVLGSETISGGPIYFKPGFSVDPDEMAGDRDWIFEIGLRSVFVDSETSWRFYVIPAATSALFERMQ